MNKTSRSLLVACSFVFAAPVVAQDAVVAAPQHAPLLHSADARLAANKRLVYDFWREVLEAGQLQAAERYLAESYIQHNPNVPTGRAGFVNFFAKFSKARPVDSAVKAPLVSIVAEGEMVVFSFVKDYPDANNAGARYTTTWFDMFRVQDGKITEHWDSALKN